MDMDTIERLAKTYSEARDALSAEVRTTEEEMAAVKRRHLPAIRRRVTAAANAKAELEAAVGESKALFRKPRTRILHGVKVGWKKGTGKVTYADEGRVVTLIRRHLADRFDDLVKVTEKPLKGALAKLSGEELKKIGASVEDAGDEVVVAPADSEIDKLVDALLDDNAAEAAEEAA